MSGKKEGVKETERERALADLAMNRLLDYKSRWLPVQRNLAKSVAGMGDQGSAQRRQAKGIASTETAARFAGAGDKLESGLANTVGLGSSKSKLALTGLGDDSAASTGMGLGLAEQQIDDAYTSGLSTIMQLGMGQKATATQGMARSAGLSGQRAAADADIALDSRMGNAQLAGQVVGTGLGYYGRQAPPSQGVNGTNDIAGVNGTNAMDQWSRFGSGGD